MPRDPGKNPMARSGWFAAGCSLRQVIKAAMRLKSAVRANFTFAWKRTFRRSSRTTAERPVADVWADLACSLEQAF